MDPSKLNSGMENSGYGYFTGGYNGQNQMSYGYPSASFADPSAGANYMNSAMNFGGADLGDSSGLMNMIPPNDQNNNYYQEYCRLFIANVVLTTQMKELISEKNELLTRLSELERGEKHVKEPALSPGADKKARIRRKAADVERHYKCPNDACQKNYGSEGSLLQHIKLKHPEITDDPDWKMKILQKSEASEAGKDN
jgi:hypothetical protein